MRLHGAIDDAETDRFRGRRPDAERDPAPPPQSAERFAKEGIRVGEMGHAVVADDGIEAAALETAARPRRLHGTRPPDRAAPRSGVVFLLIGCSSGSVHAKWHGSVGGKDFQCRLGALMLSISAIVSSSSAIVSSSKAEDFIFG